MCAYLRVRVGIETQKRRENERIDIEIEARIMIVKILHPTLSTRVGIKPTSIWKHSSGDNNRQMRKDFAFLGSYPHNPPPIYLHVLNLHVFSFPSCVPPSGAATKERRGSMGRCIWRQSFCHLSVQW
jgi:hypothetical protein